MLPEVAVASVARAIVIVLIVLAHGAAKWVRTFTMICCGRAEDQWFGLRRWVSPCVFLRFAGVPMAECLVLIIAAVRKFLGLGSA